MPETLSLRLAAAVVRCYDLMIERRTPGAIRLYDAVSEAFAVLAHFPDRG